MNFEDRKRQARADIAREMEKAAAVFSAPDKCAQTESAAVVKETMAAGWFAAFVAPDEDELKARISACQLRQGRAKVDAVMLHTRLILTAGKIIAAKNDNELEAAYIDTPIGMLRPLMLARLDRVLAVFHDRSRSVAFVRVIIPNVSAPFLAMENETRRYRDRVSSATSCLQIMRLMAEWNGKLRGSAQETMSRVGAVVSGGATGLALEVAPQVVDAVGDAAGEALRKASKSVLSLIWGVIKPILPYVLIGGTGLYIWKKRDKLFVKRNVSE